MITCWHLLKCWHVASVAARLTLGIPPVFLPGGRSASTQGELVSELLPAYAPRLNRGRPGQLALSACSQRLRLWRQRPRRKKTECWQHNCRILGGYEFESKCDSVYAAFLQERVHHWEKGFRACDGQLLTFARSARNDATGWVFTYRLWRVLRVCILWPAITRSTQGRDQGRCED